MSGKASTSAHFSGIARTVELPPDPRIAEALGLQHSIETALADIIDNSIEAGANSVWVRFITDREQLERILVVDDGSGMSAQKLEASLQLGAQREYGSGSLGMYGIGLKASAFSLADALTVTSISEGEAPAAMTTPRVQDDAFRAYVHTAADADARIIATEVPLELAHGTIVDLRGIRGASVDDDPSVRRAWLDARIRRLRNHFGLVFHRFIDSERVRLTIDVYDGRLRDAGPPFHPIGIDPLRPPTGKLGYPRTMTLDLPDGVTAGIEAHILAPGSKTGDVLIFGESRNDWQGIYVYRNDRLLRLGGWDEVTPKKTDLQLARVLIEIGENDIQWFGMNAEKNGVTFSPELARAIQSAGDEDVSFRDFLQDARDLLRQSNRRDRNLKPIAAMGTGLPESVEEVAGAVFGFREHEKSVNVRWQSFPPGRLFSVDPERATIWLNERHRDALRGGSAEDEHALVKSLLFLLFEGHFGKAAIHQITRDRIAGIERVLGAALGIEIAAMPGVSGDLALDLPDSDAPVEVADVAPVHPLPVDASGDDLTEVADDSDDPDYPDREPAVIDDDVDDRWSGDDDDESRPATVPPLSEWKSDSMRLYLDAVGRHPLLRADEEVALARRIEAGVFAAEKLEAMEPHERRSQFGRELAWIARDGERAMERMVSSNLRLVISIAKRYQRHGLDLLDLIQEGNTGLLRAVEKYDYEEGVKFSTYATWWIRQAITRGVADQGATIRLPVHMAEFGSKVGAAARTLRRELDREPSDQEIAVAAGEDLDKVTLYRRMSKPLLSLNAPLEIVEAEDPEDLEPDEFGVPDETTVEFGDVIAEEFDLVETAIGRSMLSSKVDEVLLRLDERAAEVLRLRFGLDGDEPKTLDQIGVHFRVTRERVRQIEAKALKRLRDPEIMDALGLVPPPSAVALQGASGVETSLAEATASTGIGHERHPGHELLRAYRELRHVRSAAAVVVMNDRDAAIALTRLLLWESGPIDDHEHAANHGGKWDNDEVERVIAAHVAGVPLALIAESVGRTQLAVGWRLLDNTSSPVAIAAGLESVEIVAAAWEEIERRIDDALRADASP